MKYRIYCQTDSKWEYVIKDVEPTACPVDGAHSVDLDSVSVVDLNPDIYDGTIVELPLDQYKSYKIKDIDERTKELIFNGCLFDSTLFSLSETAQRNWIALDTMRLELTYPFSVSTKDDGEYTFANAVDLHNFALTALATVDAHYTSGRSLKQSVNAATNKSEVDAVVDSR